MKRGVVFVLIIFSAGNTITGCRKVMDSNESRASASEIWLIPAGEVYDGGPGKDQIPALVNPDFTRPELATYLSDEDLVLGVVMGGDVRAYPHSILDWHEIVNDVVGGTAISITYCPLTGSGIAWDRTLNAAQSTFGVSGLLYNSNLIPFDRGTGSHWSQMKLQCVNGPLTGEFAKTYQVLETTWKSWKELYRETSVLSSSTGYSRPYGKYPYGDYKQTDQLIFPVRHDDTRLQRKERVLGVLVGEKTKVYPLANFSDSLSVMNETLNGVSIVVVGSSGGNFAASFEARLVDETLLTFTPVPDRLPIVMIDQEGTTWDIFGRGIVGPRAGKQLRPTRSFIAYWFAWGAFYPGVEIHPR